MKGHFVERRFGWDCHGLPIEYEIDKKGGSVWAMVPEMESARFLKLWAQRYRKEHPRAAKESVFFQSAAGGHAFQF
jgi:isoleucyl-tRNA synthetase